MVHELPGVLLTGSLYHLDRAMVCWAHPETNGYGPLVTLIGSGELVMVLECRSFTSVGYDGHRSQDMWARVMTAELEVGWIMLTIGWLPTAETDPKSLGLCLLELVVVAEHDQAAAMGPS